MDGGRRRDGVMVMQWWPASREGADAAWLQVCGGAAA